MPLIRYCQNPKYGTSAIWKIVEDKTFFLKELDIPNEQIPKLTQIGELEWLASRLLAKKIDNLEPHEILKNEFGKPYPKRQVLELSISHSHSYAAYGSSNCDIGIDLQIVKPKIRRIAKKYTDEAELSVLPDQFTFEEKLHFLWTIKEAIFKLYGRKQLPFLDGIRVINCAIEGKQLKSQGIIKKQDESLAFSCYSFKEKEYFFTKTVFDKNTF